MFPPDLPVTDAVADPVACIQHDADPGDYRGQLADQATHAASPAGSGS